VSELVLHGVSIEAGATAVVRLPIARLPTGTLIELPVHVVRGAEPGKTLLVQAGLHGDEVNSIELLRRMLAEGAFQPARGTVLVVPILNVFGFLHFSRDVPDGKDVNRSFPGNRNGSLASRVASTLMREVFPHCDAAIDLHTGGGRRFNAPQIRYTESQPGSLALAEAFGAPFRFPAKLIPRSFRHAAARKDVPVIVYEAGESLRLDEDGIRLGTAGVLRVLAHLGLTDAGPPLGETVHVDQTRWVRAPRAGLFRSRVVPGQAVQVGEPLGEVAEPTGGEAQALTSKLNGHVVTLNHLPVVNRGDALIRIGV